ncbi:MAG TPA: phenylalanine--tRNA ligase subunit beta [Longimicrobium sp.]|jgi:phenylalanyl-tRNA synthetase beta chain
MDVSYRWLKSLAPGIEGTPREVADRLARLGAPVDEIVDLGHELGDVVIAYVEDVRQHPNADRLRLCTVVAGNGGAPLQVVCGAPNVEPGHFYPFAPVGSTLPGGVEIRKAKIRGEASEGMLCSARELGLGRDHAGIMTLNGRWEPGTRFREALGLDDWRLVVDVTPNRGELLSHVGIARELAPGGVDGIDLPKFPGAPKVTLPCISARRERDCGGVHVEIEDKEGCPRYMGAIVRGVRVGPSPEWLAGRLRAVGQRPINNVVDATNYVLQELGQPLHAFDLAKLRGEVVIRRARAGETLRTLDGVDRELVEADLVIADGEGPVALAGVMGGENSEVGDATTDLFLECALFDPKTVRRTARRLGLSTDASYRFERGVDPEGQPEAMQRLVELILAVAGGRVVAAVDIDPLPWERPAIALRPERVERVLGLELTPDEIARLLRPLGFDVKRRSQPVRVAVPGYRSDVRTEIDLIEEIARLRGYDSFPEELLPFRPTSVPEDPQVEVERGLRAVFTGWGCREARTLPFAPGSEGAARVLNPLSQEDAYLRTSLAWSLLRRVEHNFARGVRDVRLFEFGPVFRATGEGRRPHEERRVAAALSGARAPLHWSGAAGAYDLYDLKGLLEEVAEHYPGGRVEAAEGGFALLADGKLAGRGWQAAEGEVDAPAWAAPVLLLEALLPAAAVGRRGIRYQPLPVHPGSERDLALLVPYSVSAAELEATIREAAGPLLEGVLPFDLYEGKGLEEGVRSLAWRLRFRAPERTLTDREVDAAVDRVLQALEERHGVRRR